MCLIMVKKKNIPLPKEEWIKNAASTNKDGIGVAYWKVNSNEVVIKKNFKHSLELIDWLKVNIQPEDALIIHFRIATHGLVDEGNRHPFPVTKNVELLRQTELVCQLAVAHNGVLSDYKKHEKYSDTQKFILDILSDEVIKTNLKNEKIQKLIVDFITKDKLAFLFPDGDMLLLGDYNEREGLYFSNFTYNWSSYDYKTGYGDNWGDRFNRNYKKPKDTTSTKDNIYEVCEGCQLTYATGILEMDFKKHKYILCKSCRTKLQKGDLKKLEDEKNKVTNETQIPLLLPEKKTGNIEKTNELKTELENKSLIIVTPQIFKPDITKKPHNAFSVICLECGAEESKFKCKSLGNGYNVCNTCVDLREKLPNTGLTVQCAVCHRYITAREKYNYYNVSLCKDCLLDVLKQEKESNK